MRLFSALIMLVPVAVLAPPAQAAPAKPAVPVAPPGPGPVDRPLPAEAAPNHGLPAGQKPPIVPPGVRASGAAKRLSASSWAAVPKPGQAKRAAAAPASGAANLLLRSGFALDDTSLVLYFDAVAPGVDAWASWTATVYDPETGAAQQSVALSPQDAARCGVPRQLCHSFGADQGWTLEAGRPYFVTITVTLKDGTQAVSEPSGNARARTTTSPPALPAGQAGGCGCSVMLAPTTQVQQVRGVGVATGSGSFSFSTTDLRMAAFGVPFEASRTYSSANATAGTLGIGWAWSYDMRVIPPAAGETAVTVRADDGSQVVYQRRDDGSYRRPPGVRSTLTTVDGGWRITTPEQLAYSFDGTGRLTAIRNQRGHGTTVAYTATEWTITDAAGRKVVVQLGTDQLVKAITLPDGRSVRYRYAGGQLTEVTDAAGATWKFGYTNRLLTTMTDPFKRVIVTTTYEQGRVARQADANGAVTKFSFAADKQEATTIDADGVTVLDGYRGNVLIYTQNGNGDTSNQRYTGEVDPNLTVDPRGDQREAGFDAAGNPTSATAPDPFGFVVRNTFDERNNRTAHTDGLGRTTAYGYNEFDDLTSVTDPEGGKIEVTVDERGLMTRSTDPRGKSTTFAYDAAGNLVATTTPLGEKTSYTYDNTGRRLSVTDARGFTTTYTYDALDRIRKTREPGKQKPSETVYDLAGQTARTIDPLGLATSHDYAKVIGRVVATTDANGHTTEYAYTAAGRRKSTTTAAGERSTYTYDSRGNLATTVSPRGNVPGANAADFTTTYRYDADNNLIRVSRAYPGGGFVHNDTRFDELDREVARIDARGRVTATGYNNNSQIVSVTDPLNRSTTIEYDDAGRPRVVTEPGGGATRIEHDAAGNKTRSTSATGGVTTWTYDDNGNIATSVEPRGNADGADPADYTTRYAYDAVGNVTAVTDPLGNVTRFAHDAVNRQNAVTDAAAHTVKYRYDDGDRLSSVTGADGAVTAYGYDGADKVTSRTDPNEHRSVYTYDKVNRLSSATDPLGRTSAYRYDAEGHLTKIVTPGSADEAKRSIVMSYDLLGRRVGQDIAAGRTIHAWGYDADNRITSMADAAGLRTQVYDEAGRLRSAGRGEGQTFRYGYDDAGNVTSRTWPDGTTVTADFDAGNRLTTMDVAGGAAGAETRYSFGYDAADRLTRTTHPGGTGLVTSRAYDRAGRLSEVSSTRGDEIVSRYQLTLDPVGNPATGVTTRGATSQTVGYTYDKANRLTAACVGGCSGTPTGKITYGYDPAGNRLSQSLTGSAGSGLTKYSYDDADQLQKAVTTGAAALTGGGTTVTYDYDDLGNQIRAGDDKFAYNLDSTLLSAKVGGVETSYAYDAQGLRLSANSDTAGEPTSRRFATDVNRPVPALALETTFKGTEESTRGFLTDAEGRALGLAAGNKVSTYAPDWLGGVTDVLDPQGALLASYDFDPFGNPRTDGTASDADRIDNPIRFAGAYQDGTLGSRYAFPARVYDPGTGRFGGVDPVAPSDRAPAVSDYAYVSNRPTALIDPTGQCLRLDDRNGPCINPRPSPATTTTPDPGLVAPPVRTYPLPRIVPPPPTPVLPPALRKAGRAGGIGLIVVCLLFCLSGDSAPDSEYLDVDTDERKKGCLDNDSPPTEPEYWELKDGRAQGVEACLGPWSVNREDGQPPTPKGFQSGMNRSHLLARSLGGAAIMENIVPMWERANKSGMQIVENAVRRLITSDGKVYYVARPEYPKPWNPTYKYLKEAPILVRYFYASKTQQHDPVVLNVSD